MELVIINKNDKNSYLYPELSRNQSIICTKKTNFVGDKKDKTIYKFMKDSGTIINIEMQNKYTSLHFSDKDCNAIFLSRIISKNNKCFLIIFHKDLDNNFERIIHTEDISVLHKEKIESAQISGQGILYVYSIDERYHVFKIFIYNKNEKLNCKNEVDIYKVYLYDCKEKLLTQVKDNDFFMSGIESINKIKYKNISYIVVENKDIYYEERESAYKNAYGVINNYSKECIRIFCLKDFINSVINDKIIKEIKIIDTVGLDGFIRLLKSEDDIVYYNKKDFYNKTNQIISYCIKNNQYEYLNIDYNETAYCGWNVIYITNEEWTKAEKLEDSIYNLNEIGSDGKNDDWECLELLLKEKFENSSQKLRLFQYPDKVITLDNMFSRKIEGVIGNDIYISDFDNTYVLNIETGTFKTISGNYSYFGKTNTLVKYNVKVCPEITE